MRMMDENKVVECVGVPGCVCRELRGAVNETTMEVAAAEMAVAPPIASTEAAGTVLTVTMATAVMVAEAHETIPTVDKTAEVTSVSAEEEDRAGLDGGSAGEASGSGGSAEEMADAEPSTSGVSDRGRRGRRGRRGGAQQLAAKFKTCRKRANTNPRFTLPYKRLRKDAIIPPTKFLLGGNISDPLNLNSLQDEAVDRAMNAVTPESSPLPTPPRHKAKVDVLIPPDVHDPLNLLHSLSDEEYEKRLESQPPPHRVKRSRRRARTRRRTSETNGDTVSHEDTLPSDGGARERSASESEAVPGCKHKDKKSRRMDSMDKIVSPVVPQPGARVRARPTRAAPERAHPPGPQPLPSFHPKHARYQYGNYDRYYGYRQPGGAADVRLEVLQQYRHVFLNKDVLDVGCNVGHLTIAAARVLGARSVTGVDIDHSLVARARRNLQAFSAVPSDPPPRRAAAAPAATAAPAAPAAAHTPVLPPPSKTKKKKKNRKSAQEYYFPASFSQQYGPLCAPAPAPAPAVAASAPAFPHNVYFKQGDYVLREEGAADEQYDVVMCLSTTKWLHLNHGDAGLKLAFRRMFSDLRPGGKLVLEPQAWASYKRRKRLTAQIYSNYNSIELLPHKFRDYLLSPEVGFSRCVVMGAPRHGARGFRRPLQLFVKGEFTPRAAQWSDGYAPHSSQHRPDAPPLRPTVYAAAPTPDPPPSPSPPPSP